MTSRMKCLALDYERYHKTFRLFLELSSEHQAMSKFIHESLPDIFARIGEGKTTFDVISVGSGTGEVDLEILSQLIKVLPDVKVGCDMVEPSEPMLEKCKELVSRTPNLGNVNFTWNQMTASEFEKHWRERQSEKKLDFIHMIQMLYYVTDTAATISFFRSLLNENGKLLIILVAGESSWGKLWGTYQKELCCTEITQCVTAADIKRYLTAEGISFETFVLPSTMDITECFIPGDEKGELLLDFLTEVLDFSHSAPPELKAGVMSFLRSPDCSSQVNGRIIFNNNLEVLVLDP
ncbi:histamine N-methyltransferase-like [Paramormyrops kingsleyae]|uniref:Histamine N-methyltransferase n=1 Tax=Paramormyrops kingsleyae TaxID=1676925 RepID=A0A3B3R1Z3_9TELE|nr:histamine N-methyltransferase-like [Paramormyrops kingsleyae]XP_023664708.1 histamine N-methyltransferase-like [Paramormyrops kingsleyae]